MRDKVNHVVSKGKISALHDGGKTVEVKPYTGELVTARLVVPFFLFEGLEIGMEVVYSAFDDNTGLVLARMDGEWNHDLKGKIKVEEQVEAMDFHTDVAKFNTHTHTTTAGESTGPN